MSAINIANQLLQLASNVANQTHIARDAGCLGGLLSLLAHEDDEVVTTALKALSLLSSHPSNRSLMVEHPGLVTAVRNISTNWGSSAPASCAEILTHLSVKVDPGAGESGRDRAVVQTVVTVRFPDLREGDDLDRARRAAVGVRGVVSVTDAEVGGSGAADAGDALCEFPGIVVTMRTTAVTPADIVAALGRSGLSSRVTSEDTATARRGDAGDDEEDGDVADAENNGAVGNAVDIEDALRGRGAAGAKAKASKARKSKKKGPAKQITLNAEDCSLEARLAAEQRRLEQRESKVSKFFSKLGFW